MERAERLCVELMKSGVEHKDTVWGSERAETASMILGALRGTD